MSDAIRHSIPTITLPRAHPSAPPITFAADMIKLRLKLAPNKSERSVIWVFDHAGHDIYSIDSSHRDWRSALVTVGKLLADNPELYADA